MYYLNGYVNVDYPPTTHTVQTNLVADRYEDISCLSYPNGSLEEIRLHHVFEHFSRPIALALLCRWRDWLKPGGLLRIETPDAMACFKLMALPLSSFDSKQQVMRHLFGSHEAAWAVHCDGWYKEKFDITLKLLGFTSLRFTKNKYGMLRNLEVFAYKSDQELCVQDYIVFVEKLLRMSTIRTNAKDKRILQGSELDLLQVWMKTWRAAYECQDH